MTGKRPFELSLRQCMETSFPPVTLKLLGELVHPEPDFDSIAAVLKLDPGLSTNVLGMVNSPYYALQQKVGDLKKAAVVLGVKELLKTTISASFLGELGKLHPGREVYPAWRVLVWSAIASELLAKRLCPKESAEAYLCALLKDISLLLISRESPDSLPSGLDGGILTCLGPEQLREEAERWGLDHCELSKEVQHEIGLPEGICKATASHHDLEDVDRLPPLARSVALGTRWAEMVLGCEPDPQAAVRFEVMLKNILDVGVGELEELRREVMSHFKSMLTSLGIEEPSPDERLYEFSLQQMQTYYFQSMDLTGLTGGPDQAAEIVARHMRWNFNLERFQFTLRIPAGEHMLLYTADEKGVRRESGPAPAVDVAWSVRRRGFALLSGGESWGEIRTLVKPMDKQHAEIALYARFLGLGYEQYCLRQAVLEMKAHTLDSLPVGVARLDADGRTLQVNPRLAEFLGADEHDEDVTRYLPVSRFFGAEQEWLSFLRDPQSRTFSRIFCAGGVLEGDPEDMDRCLYLWASKRKVRERDEVLLLVEDVSQVSDLEVQALKQREFLKKLVASMRDVVLVVDRQGVITYVSPLLPESFIGLSVFEIANPMGHFAGIWGPHYLEARKEPLEAVILTGERELRPYELVFTPLRPGLDGKQSFLVVGRDLSTVRRLEEKLKRQAIYDGLTGLFNHEQFLAILKQEVERAERTGRGRPAVVFIDLDGFKAINDRYGHQVGDEVLKFVGKAIRSNIRSGMDFPCRYGGDEFTVVLTEVDRASDLDRLCQRIKAGINKAWREHLSVSIGAAMRAGEEDAEELLRRADRSVYKAKTSGGDRIIFGDSA